MNPAIIGVFIPIVTVIGGICMVIFLRYYENIERMAMIEKGMNPNTDRPRRRANPSTTLRFALLAIGAGLGILFGNMLEKTMQMEEEVAFFSMILIFGGLGLLASYVLELRLAKQEEKQRKETAYGKE
jgi:hypothetical protein